MRVLKLVGAAVLTLLRGSLVAQAQQAGAMPPPDIVQLIQKLSKGQELTGAEQQRLDDWSASQDAKDPSRAGSGGASPPTGGAASLMGDHAYFPLGLASRPRFLSAGSSANSRATPDRSIGLQLSVELGSTPIRRWAEAQKSSG
jgi:hypothetical protein